ncbi:MAG TPA: hypothetical protein VFU81_22760 [Thermomicrobiales bacterium]|nr:hypothetical protein [Thermomicrobiales bacterium]
MRRLAGVVAIIGMLLGLAALGVTFHAGAQVTPGDIRPPGALPDYERGESVFTDATPVSLAVGLIPAYPPLPAAIALQRVVIAPGGVIATPGDDPRLVIVVVEQGALTVRNTVPVVVTRATQQQETLPADTPVTLGPGDAFLSPAHSGGDLRNLGTAEVRILAGILLPLPAATPEAVGTPAS